MALAAPASASRAQLSFFDASNEENGAMGAAVRDRSLDELKALGVDVVRFQVSWRSVAPSPDSPTPPPGFDPRNQFTYGAAGVNWGAVDAVVKGAAARGMKVDLVLSGSPPTGKVPRWASGDPSGSQSDPSPKAFEDFAYAVGQRYGGGAGAVGPVQFISIWNEPNSMVFLRAAPGQGESAIALLYRQLVIAGQTGLSAAGWPGTVLIGELGPTPPGKLSRPIPFLSRVLCLRKGRLGGGCARLNVGGVAHHPYSFGRAPFQAALNSGQISIGNLGLLQRLLNRARRAGAISSEARLYNTEYGYPSSPDVITGTPRRRQAEFISIAEYLTYNMPGVASYAQYLMRDDPPGSISAGFTSGLCTPSAPDTVSEHGVGCKPAFGAYRTALVVRAGKGAHCAGPKRVQCLAAAQAGPVTVWGHIRPATGPTTAQIRIRNAGGRAVPLRTVRTDASGYFQFRARGKPGRLWSVSWNGLSGSFVRAYAF